jgi:hypothetical protein
MREVSDLKPFDDIPASFYFSEFVKLPHDWATLIATPSVFGCACLNLLGIPQIDNEAKIKPKL